MPHPQQNQLQWTPNTQQEWNGQEVDSVWEYEEDRTKRISCGNQAMAMAVMKRRARQRGSRWEEPQRFVCKYYSTASRDVNYIGGQKYVRRELENLRRCEHPNILRCVDFAYSPSPPRLAQLYTEYCPMGDLEQFEITNEIRRNSLTHAECAQVFYQLAQALLYLHHGVSKTNSVLQSVAAAQIPAAGGQAGQPSGQQPWQAILHRDIKPANGMYMLVSCASCIPTLADCLVFVTMRSRGVIHVKLGDFGISRLDAVGTMTSIHSNLFAAPVRRTMHQSAFMNRYPDPDRSKFLLRLAPLALQARVTFSPWAVSLSGVHVVCIFTDSSRHHQKGVHKGRVLRKPTRYLRGKAYPLV